VADRRWHFEWLHETGRVWPLLSVTAEDDQWLGAQLDPSEPDLGGFERCCPGDPVVTGGRGDPEQPPDEVDVEWRTGDGELLRQTYRRPAGR
jgi:hypothetical protein